MWDKTKWKNFARGLWRRPWLLLAGVLGLVLLVVGAVGVGEKEETATGADTSESDAYRHALEAEIAEACSQVRGVGKTKVILTIETGESYLYDGSRKTGTVPPEVRGVVIICEGGGSDRVKRELTDLVCALCHLSANRVYIAEMR